MVKNGFKSYLYKWVKKPNQSPQRILIGIYDINQIDTDNLNLRNVTIENKTRLKGNLYKGKNKKFGCFDNNNKSLITTYSKHKIKAYSIL